MKERELFESWLNDPDIDEETKKELEAIKDDDGEIDDRFFKDLEFGTGGLRGVIGAGTNRMNKYTVCKATQGLADYINTFFDGGVNEPNRKPLPGKEKAPEKSVCICCDSRHFSAEFSEWAALCLNANGIKTYVFEDLRPTPELSFSVRELNAIAGINITASHNPREYNGYKAYWADGAQVTPPHDEGIMEYVEKVKNLSSPKLMDKKEALEKGLFVEIGKAVDERYLEEILKQVREPEILRQEGKAMKIAYTPLHGAGIRIVPEALKRAGVENLFVVPEQEKPNGDFPTVPYPNPETEEAFALVEKLAKEKEADIAIATDPDADRIGIHVRDAEGNYHTLTGNEIGCLMLDYELERLAEQNIMPKDAAAVRSIVSSKLFDVIAKERGVSVREVLTGFKWIGAEILSMEEKRNGTYVFGFEESYGFLTGTHARDKDSCVSALKLAEICAFNRHKGINMYDAMQNVFKKYGFSKENTISVTMKGIDGMKAIQEKMTQLRKNPPTELAGLKVKAVRDYNKPEETGLPKSNVLYFEMEDAWAAVRPSGTEPKIKYYIGVRAETPEKADEMLKKIEESFVK